MTIAAKNVSFLVLVVIITIMTLNMLYWLNGHEELYYFKLLSQSGMKAHQNPNVLQRRTLTDKPQNTVTWPGLLESNYLSLRNFTIVTAFFNLGNFKKHQEKPKRNSTLYVEWMQVYGSIQNVVIAYFDDEYVAKEFSKIRGRQPTEVIVVNRSELWAFSLVNRTHDIFMQRNYPKDPPRSTVPEYDAVMHAKFELLARTVQAYSAYGSSYIAWMDIGIYRELPKNSTGDFMLRAPPCHRDDAIMFAQVFKMNPKYTVRSAMRNGKPWVAGGFFIAKRSVVVTFYAEYARNVELYLNQGLANDDQSVLLAMYIPSTYPRPSLPLQVILPVGPENPWFYMAYQARRDWLAVTNGTDDVSIQHVSCSYDMYT